MSSVGYQGVIPPQEISVPLSDLMRQTREHLKEADRLRLSGETDRALAICEQLVRQHPRYMGALHTLGMIFVDRRDYPRALGFLVRASMLNPRHWQTLTVLSNVYLKLDAPEMAAQTLETALQVNPDDPATLSTLGEIYFTQREYELAAEKYHMAISIDHTLLAAEFRLGMCRIELGQYEEAAAELENLLKLSEKYSDQSVSEINPLFRLADLPPGFVKVDLLPKIDAAERPERLDKVDFETSVNFARALALDKIGRHAEAWQNLVAGNRAIYRMQRDECKRAFRVFEDTLTRTRNSKQKVRGGTPGKGRHAISLFILGPSRSGKTTVEKLVSGIDGVKRGYENPIAENAVRHAFQAGGFLSSERYDDLPRELDKSCRNLYLDDLEFRAGSAKIFTNTHPGRIVDALRIASIVPNTRFIFVKRNIDDATLKIYMKKYYAHWPFAYDLDSIRQYLSWYYEMIDVLAENLPKISLVLQYEEVVADPTHALRAAADLCGLEVGDARVGSVGDDCGCAEPYREFLAAELKRTSQDS